MSYGVSVKAAKPAAGVRAGVCLTFLLILVNACFAQDEQHHLTLNVGRGLTTITGREAGRLDHGWEFSGWRWLQLQPFFGITGNFMFDQLGITGRELLRLNVPNGSGRVYCTVSP